MDASPQGVTWAVGTFAGAGREFAGLVVGEYVHPIGDLVGLSQPSVRDLLEHWPYVLPALDRLAGGPVDGAIDLADLDVRPPVEPRQIFRSATSRSENSDGTPAGDPFVYVGLPSAICGPYDDIVLPTGTNHNDNAVELVAVIGSPARRVRRENALQHVAGYTIANGLTCRDRVGRDDPADVGPDWFRSQGPPTFLPLGPFIVASRFVGDPSQLSMTLRRNDELVQYNSTRELRHDVATLIAYCSSVATLLPGDLVLTGAGGFSTTATPLRPGDVLTAEVGGLGVLRNGCIGESRSPATATSAMTVRLVAEEIVEVDDLGSEAGRDLIRRGDIADAGAVSGRGWRRLR